MNRVLLPLQIALAVFFCFCLSNNSRSATSASLIETSTKLDPPSIPPTHFGWSLSAHNGKVLIGGFNNYAYIYDIVGGHELFRLRGNDTSINDLFGRAVALNDDYAIVGANQVQAAYVFDAYTGNQIRKFTALNASGFGFGTAVALNGDLAVIGDSSDETKGSDAGAVHIFRVSTGELTRTLYPSAFFSIFDHFGAAVDIQGDILVVGAPGADAAGLNSGAAYVYQVSSGSLLHTLAPNVPGSGFGNEIVIADNMVMVGKSNLSGHGAAYLFDLTSGEMLRKFSSPNPMNDALFGNSIAFDGRRALIGSWGEFQNGNYWVGSAYLFDVETGNLLASWLPSELGLSSDEFGYSVALDGNYMLASTNRGGGSVYITVIPEPGTLMLTGLAALMSSAGAVRRR